MNRISRIEVKTSVAECSLDLPRAATVSEKEDLLDIELFLEVRGHPRFNSGRRVDFMLPQADFTYGEQWTPPDA